ncbi:MAG TPA: phosphonoacetaldehyde hydrolase [Candidatus Methylomirabilis sp.]|nr:phosphonoacetaldehyde hydrolase [Candidatus Methylomirabilis sp.]
MEFVFRRSYRGPVKLVILDWAGTTMDYGCYAPAVVFQEVYRRRGVEISMEQARRPMGLHKREHIRALSRMDEVAGAWMTAHGRSVTDQDVEEMFRDFQPLQLQCLAGYADLIPGTLETVAALRARGVRIGSTTGYFTEAMELLKAEAARRGYVPESSVCATQVPAGRPHPWMVMQNMLNTGVYPAEAVVKIGDTKPDIGEGLNAGVWTIGVAKTGNEMGLNLEEIKALDEASLARRLDRAREALAMSGAHYVVDGISDVLPVLEEINARLARGERP